MSNKKFKGEEREKKKRKGRDDRRQTVNVTIIHSGPCGNCVASNTVVEVGVPLLDNGSRHSKSTELPRAHIPIHFFNNF